MPMQTGAVSSCMFQRPSDSRGGIPPFTTVDIGGSCAYLYHVVDTRDGRWHNENSATPITTVL